MLIPTIIMGIVAIVLFAIASKNGNGQNIEGIKIGFRLTVQVLPLLIFAFIIAGFVQILLPQDMISKWVGAESGFRGIMIGTLAGGITPGGPFVSFPLVAGLLKAGAGAGTMVAFLTSWSLLGVVRLPMEVGIIGWKFAILRTISVFLFPPIAGLIANQLSKILK